MGWTLICNDDPSVMAWTTSTATGPSTRTLSSNVGLNNLGQIDRLIDLPNLTGPTCGQVE